MTASERAALAARLRDAAQETEQWCQPDADGRQTIIGASAARLVRIARAAAALLAAPARDRERLAAIQRRLSRATSGPWCAENCGQKCNAVVVGVAYAASDDNCDRPLEGWPEFEDERGEELAVRTEIVCEFPDTPQSVLDADLIANAWTDIAWLLARLGADRG